MRNFKYAILTKIGTPISSMHFGMSLLLKKRKVQIELDPIGTFNMLTHIWRIPEVSTKKLSSIAQAVLFVRKWKVGFRNGLRKRRHPTPLAPHFAQLAALAFAPFGPRGVGTAPCSWCLCRHKNWFSATTLCWVLAFDVLYPYSPWG